MLREKNELARANGGKKNTGSVVKKQYKKIPRIII
jgi:hypothetical protein